MSSARARVVRVIAGLVALLAALLALRLGSLENKGPVHWFESIGPDGIPATLYLPYDTDDLDDGEPPYQPEPGDRPPVVVVAHGYSADQRIMSPLARSLAEAGYAVVTFDFRGHGSNTNAFAGDLTDDFDAVVDWVERSPQVDGSRLAVLGHSMGASAVLDFATQDDRPLAVVPFSGGYQVKDAVTPRNVLLIAGEGDPGRIKDRQAEIAADLEGATNVERVLVSGKDHTSVLTSNTAIEEIVGFLDPIMGVERDGEVPGLDDDRLRPAATYVLVLVPLIGFVGLLTAKLVQANPSAATAGGLVLIAGALALTTPLMAVGGFSPLPLGAGQQIVTQSLLAAGALWGTRLLVQRGVLAGPFDRWIGAGRWTPTRPELLTGIGTAAGLVLLLLPLQGVAHRLVPTPERLVYWVLLTAAALPFMLAFEGLVRRGETWQAVGWGAAGRLIIIVSLFVGLAIGTLPGVIALVAPLLIFQYVLLEVFAATCYARGRNPAVIAVVESVFIAFMAVTLTPVG